MNETEFGQQIAKRLSGGAGTLPEAIAGRLYEARRTALSAYPAEDSVAVGGALLAMGRRMQAWHYGIVTVLVFGALFAFNAYRSANEGVDVELAVLAGDLPPVAYLDKDFDQWLNCAR